MSPFIHALITLVAFVPLALWIGPTGAALVGIVAYWGREGAEAQRATRLPKSETWWMPWAPWTWQRQMQLDLLGPVLAMLAARLAWWVLVA